MASISEAFAKYQQDHPGDATVAEAPEPERGAPPESAKETPAEPAAEQAPSEKRPSLDDVLPDDPRLPVSMRGKSIAALIDYNHEKDQAAQKAAQERNEYREKYEASRIALESLGRLVPRETSAPTPKPKASEKMRRSGVDPREVFTDVNTAFDAVGEAASQIAREEIVPEVTKKIEALEKQLVDLQEQRRQEALQQAFREGRPENISADVWNGRAALMTSYVVGNSRNPFDPESYREASRWVDDEVKKAGGGNGRAINTAASTPPAPKAPAPPVGNGDAAPPARKPSAKIPASVRGAFDDVTAVLQRVTKSKKTTDDVLESMRKSGRYKGWFEE